MANKIIAHGREQAVGAIIRLLPRISADNLVRLTSLAQWLTEDLEVLKGIKKVRHFLETPGHPAKEFFGRVLDRLPEDRRIRLFETLFKNAWFEGGKSRVKQGEALGFRPPFMMILSPTLRCNLRCKVCGGSGMNRMLSSSSFTFKLPGRMPGRTQKQGRRSYGDYTK
jgi:hypothetical protein